MRGFFASAHRDLDPADPDRRTLVFAKSTLLFFRLLVAELAHQTSALSHTDIVLPSAGCMGSELWEEWSTSFAALDRRLNRGETERQHGFLRLFALDTFFTRYGPGEEALQVALDVVRRLAHATPYETLTGAYERLLGCELCLSAARQSVLRPCRQRRRASGSFYTPLPIARLTVEEALRPILEGKAQQAWGRGATLAGQHALAVLRTVEAIPASATSTMASALPRILDPSMGTGAFLLAAARYLHETLPSIAPCSRPEVHAGGVTKPDIDISPVRAPTLATIAEECLYGVDLDPLAVQLAIHALWLETGARPAVLARHLRPGNLLGEPLRDSSTTYDAVVGNPPWGPEDDRAERGSGRKRLGRDNVDRFKQFLRLGVALSHGTLGMVVPQAVLAQSTHGDIRGFLLERFDPYSVVDLGNDAFPAAAPACALNFGPKPGPQQVRHARLSCPSLQPAWSSVPRSHCTEDGFFLVRTEMLELYARLRARHPALGEISDHIRVRDVGINYNRAAVGRRVLYQGSEPDDPRDVPRYRGRDFARYTSIRRGGWLRHDALSQLGENERLSLSWPTYLLPQKIVLRQTADRLVATLDCSRMAMGRSVIALTAKGDISLRAVLACLNSRLLTVLYRALAGEEGRVLPQVKVARLTALPIPAVCPISLPPAIVSDAAQAITSTLQDRSLFLLQRASDDPIFAWAAVDRLAELLLQAEGQDERIDALIDQTVYRLYGLKHEETLVAESKLSPISVSTPAPRSERG